MAFEKPSWLRNFLAGLEWDILTWHIDVGEPIETAIDWVLDRFSDFSEWAAEIGAYIYELVQEIKDAFATIGEAIAEWINGILDTVSTWWDSLGEWWEARKQDVKDWIDTAADWINDRIDDLKEIVDKVNVWWESFTTEILPELASKFDITEALNQFRLEWRDLFESWDNFKDTILEFFQNPLDWLLDRFTDWFLGKEE